MTKNVLGATGIGIIATVYILDAFTLPIGTLRAPNMGFVPLIIGFALLGFCLLLGLSDFMSPAKVEETSILSEEEEEGESTGYKKPLILAGALLVYPPLFTALGFIISTILLLYIALRVMEYKTWRVSLLTAVVATLITYVIFAGWLGIYFPNGIFDWR